MRLSVEATGGKADRSNSTSRRRGSEPRSHQAEPLEPARDDNDRLLAMATRLARLGGWTVDLKSGVVHLTDEACAIHEVPNGTSLPIDEAIAFYDAESRAAIAAAFAACVSEGVPYDLELGIISAKGRHIPIRSIGEAVRDPSGSVVRIQGAFQDISASRASTASSDDRYRGLLEAAPDAMVVVDQAGRIVLLNLQAERQFGYRRDELVGQQVSNIIPNGFADRLIADDLRSAEDALAQQIDTGIELIARRKNGTEFPIEIMLSPLDSAGVILITAAIRDITARQDAESHLEQSEGRYRGLLEAAPDAMVVVNQAGDIVLVNVQAEKQFGYHRDELLGQPVTNIIPEGFAARLIADDLRSAADALAQRIGTGIELSARRKDGSEFPIEIMLSPLESAEGILVTAAIRDISLRNDAEEHLAQKVEELSRSVAAARAMSIEMVYAAQHDFLTGLPNRMLLNDRISQAIVQAPRHSKQVAVLFLDLDGFKHINDSLGHSVGDQLLQSVAARIVGCVRASDTVSRQGGDEFVVLLSEAEQWADAHSVARRMLEAVAEAHPIDRRDLHITASIGVSIYPDDGQDAETLIKNADTAMYQAKEDGRQSYRFFKPAMNVRAVERQSVEEGLRRALDRGQFALHYQPKIDLRTGAISGAEALIRWMHPTRGMILPAQFIPIAEDSGLIVPIGEWVLQEACAQARVWQDSGLPVTMAVNVSAMQLRSDHFLAGLFRILRETGLGPELLEIELTESVLMKEADSAAAILMALRNRGIQVALDDFGTGYSSLSYLRKFPIDALKIDQSFVSQITAEGDDTSIVTAVVSMARSLNLRVVAEGVETLEQLAFLRAHECDLAQGYLFSKPIPPQQFGKLLRRELISSTLLPPSYSAV